MRRVPTRWICGVTLVSTLLIVFVPAIALADGLTDVGQSVDQATQTVQDTVDQATQTVQDTADQATQTVREAGSTLGDSDGAAGSVGRQSGTRESETGNEDVYSDSVALWHRTARDALTSRMTTLTSDSRITTSELSFVLMRDDPDPDTDPCQEDSHLVCLGLLFGLGDLADTGADVLGVLVKTGAVVVFLAWIALLMAILGAAALAASSDRFGLAPRRAD